MSDETKNSNENKSSGEKKNPNEKNFTLLVQKKFEEYRAEFRKIIWLSRKELTKRTVTVIITSLLFGMVIFGMDTVFALGAQSFFTLLGK